MEQSTDDGSLDVQVAVRMAGTGYVLAFLTGLAFAPVGYFLFSSAAFALLSVGFSVAYLLLPFASELAPPWAVRLFFILLLTLHYAIVLLCVGPYAGVEAFTVCLAALPLLLFAKSERLMLWVAYGTIAVGVVTAEVVSIGQPPLLVLEQSDRTSAYIANIATVATVMTFLLFSYSRSSIANYIKLQKERLKSEAMLRELVPADVAQHLLRGESVPAQSPGECTVLFADLVHFTDLAENLSPVHLVELLNGIFSDIDKLCEGHGIEKIKTIGDCYMCATGIFPHQNRIVGIAMVGTGIVDVVNHWAEKSGYPLSVRIGICTGQVISGVIGTKRPLFDIWGQTVNIAQLMESKSTGNCIFVSESTHWRLREHFAFEPVPDVWSKSGHALHAYRLVPSATYVGDSVADWDQRAK
ncbi:adenylate/guanylate cyclase domain-containing protein [Ensifer sp. 4252]|uniref:adenylate/guanylate cyclase domain-containing protein n=1 Tax=Ensifer sp. 4252 TaxID=3373915 RepID=UPI003D19FEEE